VVNVDELVIIWNPQLVQPALPTYNLNTNNISSNRNTPAIVKDNGVGLVFILCVVQNLTKKSLSGINPTGL
jgi:hypothetical protein